MQFIKIHYTGRKPFRDRASSYVWTPDEIKLVTQKAASVLTRLVEFSRVQAEGAAVPRLSAQSIEPSTEPGSEQATELEQAMLEQVELQQKTQQEHQINEGMLLSLEGMNKAALIEYAKKYETELSASKKVTELRGEVGLLIEQFGAR